nr:hypothetical protein BaRGS_002482 [Batillaria attramentaria]
MKVDNVLGVARIIIKVIIVVVTVTIIVVFIVIVVVTVTIVVVVIIITIVIVIIVVVVITIIIVVVADKSAEQIVAVGARRLEDARQFADRFNIPRAYGSYEELAEDKDIDVVYIATIHPYHYAVCRLFLEQNHNILCEKPLTLSLRGTQELLAEAQARKVFFMEGYWARCFPVYDEIRKELREGTLGEVRMLVASICLPLDSVDRIRKRELGGGGLMDIGCYAVQAANLVFPGKPEKIDVEGVFYEEGVDMGGCIILKYSGGRLANLSYHTATEDGANRLAILGSKGNIVV